MAVQPVARGAVHLARRSAKTYRGVTDFPDGIWEEFVTWRKRKQDPDSSAWYVREQRERNRRSGLAHQAEEHPRPAEPSREDSHGA